MNKAVFIDKDGTLIPDIPYNVDPALITLQADAADGLRQIQDKGYLIIIISNQSGVARGYFKEEALAGVKTKISSLLLDEQIVLNGFYYCPHYPEGIVKEYSIVCNCRKPEAGLFFKAANDLNIDLSSSWMIGDILNDMEAGKKAGSRTVLINNGNETEWHINPDRIPEYMLKTIDEAALLILRT